MAVFRCIFPVGSELYIVIRVLLRPIESPGAHGNARDLEVSKDEHSVGFLWPSLPLLQL